MKNTLQDAYNSLVSTNLLYQDNRDRWKFLLDSYIGGDEYRSGGYLTRYAAETDKEYRNRLGSTPLDNHCRSVISVYTSFLFRKDPSREFGNLSNNLNLNNFLQDADLDGRTLDSFMKDVAIWANVFGHCWIIVAKPQSNAATRAGELEQGIRPYVNLITPLTVTDWQWFREPSGAYTLDYIKYIEEVNDSFSTIKEWTREEIITSQVNHHSHDLVNEVREPNQLGRIPAIIAYSTRSPVRGFGASAISDIADHQKKIYNEYSEVEASIRLNGHPTLVKTVDVEASAGAGSIALMPDGLDPGLKPYLLDVSTDISSIYDSIEHSVSAIDKMANTGAVRATESRSMSGVAMETEFQLLNARLSELARNLELAEEQIWRWYAAYEGTVWEGEVEYEHNYNIRNKDNEFNNLKIAAETSQTMSTKALVDYRLRKMLDDPRYGIEDEESYEKEIYQAKIDKINEILAELQSTTVVNSTPTIDLTEHATTTPENRSAHIQQMIMDGYTDSQILSIHPEITQDDITVAKEILLNL
jgi:hypothetical protein